MTEVEKLDAEIVKAAMEWEAALDGGPTGSTFVALRKAVAAKRAAMQPKPLSAQRCSRSP